MELLHHVVATSRRTRFLSSRNVLGVDLTASIRVTEVEGSLDLLKYRDRVEGHSWEVVHTMILVYLPAFNISWLS